MLDKWIPRWPAALALAVAVMLAVPSCSKSKSENGANSQSNGEVNPPTTSSSDVKTPPSSQVALTETGSTLLYPLFNLWSQAYSAKYPNIKITTQGTGSGTGISQSAAGTVQIGASDAYLSPAQVTQNPGLVNIPLAISAQMVNYNIPGFKGTLKLNGKVLAAIYRGQITQWNDPQIQALNSGVTLPATKIVPVHRSDGSGDTFLFTQYLSKQDSTGWGQKVSYGTTVAFPAVAGALGESGNGGMVSACAATPGCVAYVGVSFRDQTRAKGLGEAQLQNASGSFVPLTDSTVAAEAASFASSTPASGSVSLINGTNAPQGYPIVNYEYAIVKTNQPNADQAQATRALLAWAVDPNGGASPVFLKKVYFQPLPKSASDVATTLITSIR